MITDKKYDVVVIGAGPSGATAARLFAMSGLSVAILEKTKIPRYKVCGGGVVFRALEHLPYGFDEIAELQFKRVVIGLEHEKLQFTVERSEPLISMVLRSEFDAWLTQKACESGAVLHENQELFQMEYGEQILIKCTNGCFYADYVIAADGVQSKTAKSAGWKETRNLIPAFECEIQTDQETHTRLSSEPRFDIGFVPGGYAWMFPKKNNLSIGVLSTKRGSVDLKAYYAAYLKKLGVNQIVSEKTFGAVIPVSPRKDGFCRNNVYLCGDAAGLAEPIAAEGITNALLSGRLVAEAILEEKKGLGCAADLYTQKLEKQILPQLNVARQLAGLLYSNKTLRKIAFKKRGQYLCEIMADLFTNKKQLPDKPLPEVMFHVKRKLKMF